MIQKEVVTRIHENYLKHIYKKKKERTVQQADVRIVTRSTDFKYQNWTTDHTPLQCTLVQSTRVTVPNA